MKKTRTFPIILALALAGGAASAEAFLELEGAVAFTGYNDVRIPADGGTNFSLADDFDSKPTPAFRARVGYTFLNRHTVFATVAPLTIRGSATLDRDVTFRDTTFAAGTEVDSLYRFDSYRLTYRYTFVDEDSITVAGGVTGKIRSAEITLMSQAGYERRTDLGVVPLVNLMVHWKPHDKFGLVVDMDALVTPFGRAEDVLFALQYEYSPTASLRLGYRILEGGSDGGGSVYTFALVNYATVGVTVRF